MAPPHQRVSSGALVRAYHNTPVQQRERVLYRLDL